MAFEKSLYEFDAGYFEYIPGLWLPGKTIPGSTFGCMSKKAVDEAINVELDDFDVLLGTYPKTGQTWTMTILRLILQARDLEEGNEVSLTDFYEKIPFMDVEDMDGLTGADKIRKMQPPRFMKTHLSYELWKNTLDKHPNLKVIQTLRNPRDTLVSFYHHMRSDGCLGCFAGTWDQYFEEFKKRRLPWGDFFEVNSSWYKFNKDRPNSLILRYEEMKKDHKGHVIKIAKFLGYDLPDKTIDLIVENSTVKEMSKKFVAVEKDDVTWNSNRSHFIRKGQVGDWANFFSEEQIAFMDERCKQYFEPLGLSFQYTG